MQVLTHGLFYLVWINKIHFTHVLPKFQLRRKAATWLLTKYSIFAPLNLILSAFQDPGYDLEHFTWTDTSLHHHQLKETEAFLLLYQYSGTPLLYVNKLKF